MLTVKRTAEAYSFGSLAATAAICRTNCARLSSLLYFQRKGNSPVGAMTFEPSEFGSPIALTTPAQW